MRLKTLKTWFHMLLADKQQLKSALPGLQGNKAEKMTLKMKNESHFKSKTRNIFTERKFLNSSNQKEAGKKEKEEVKVEKEQSQE